MRVALLPVSSRLFPGWSRSFKVVRRSYWHVETGKVGTPNCDATSSDCETQSNELLENFICNCPYGFDGSFASHTHTVVRECFEGDEASQWKRPKFDPSPHQNPLTDLHKNWQAWLRHGRHSTCKILYWSVRHSDWSHADETFFFLDASTVHGYEKCVVSYSIMTVRRRSVWPFSDACLRSGHSFAGQLQCHELHRNMSEYSVKSQ